MEAQVDELGRARRGGEDAYAIRAEMTATMKDHFGVFREEPTMQAGLEKLLLASRSAAASIGLRYAGGVFNLDLIRTLELEGMVDLALCRRPRARWRAPSRAGSHFAHRLHRRATTSDWLKHTLAHYHARGRPRLEYKPVTLGTFEPQERKY